MLYDGKFSSKIELPFCDPKVRGGMTVCFFEGKCKTCQFAIKYDAEHPEDMRA